MKLVIQIPCYNEAQTLPATLADLPKEIDGIDDIVVLVIDDGSSDDTANIADENGADYVVRHRTNRGLAAAFQTGMDAALRLGADVIVNTDGDNQYCGQDVDRLVAPIVRGEADIVVGDRRTDEIQQFSPTKRLLQRWGSRLVRRVSGVNVPDAVSGFRALSAEAAISMNILSRFSYTTEMLIQAGYRGLHVVSVPVRTNEKTRESRLYGTIPEFLLHSGTTILRAYTMHHPLRVFMSIGLLFSIAGVIPILRFLFFFFSGDGDGHVQSLVIGGTCLSLGAVAILLGICAEVIATNRKLNERILERLVQMEFQDCSESAAASEDSSCGSGLGNSNTGSPQSA